MNKQPNQPTEQQRNLTIRNVTLGGMIVNAVLTLFKFIAGWAGQSLAMLADSIHSLSDFVSDIIILVMFRISNKKRDREHEFGHGKFETLATFLLSIILLIVGAELLKTSIEKTVFVAQGGVLERPGMIALIAAAVSIVAKEVLYQINYRIGKRLDCPSVIANAWHHRSDALSSIGSLIGIGGAILLGEQWTILDPLMGCAISIAIFVVAVRIAAPAIKELLEISLPAETEKEIISIAGQVEGVEEIHNLQTRRNGNSMIIDAHIVVDRNLSVIDAHNICTAVEQALCERFGSHTQLSLHIEPDGLEDEHHLIK